MLDTSAPNLGESLTREEKATSPWVVYILPVTAAKWVPVCRMRSRNEAWQHVGKLQRLISTAYFDVAFDAEANTH